MEPSQPQQVTLTLPGRPVWAELIAVVISLGALAGLILTMMPAQERQMLFLALKQQRASLYRGLSAKAHRAGYEGMTSELEGNPAVSAMWYDRARGLAWWRDRVKP